MKKILFGLAALLMSVAICSCSNSSSSKDGDEGADKKDAISALKDFAKDIKKNGNDWDEVKIKEVYKDMLNCVVDFYEGLPSKDEIKDFQRISDDIQGAISSLDEDARSTFYDLKDSPEIDMILTKLEKAHSKAKKAIRENEDSEDDEE